MAKKFTFLTALKKYAKTICLLLVLGGASVAGMAQCPPETSYHEPQFTFSVLGIDYFHNNNPGTGRITIKMNLQCYGQFYTFYDDCPNHKADGVNINNLPVKVIAHCRKSDNSIYKTEEILRPIKGEHTFNTFTGLPYGDYIVNVSLVVPGSHTGENYMREFQGTSQTITLRPPAPQISFPSENANYGNGSVLGVNVKIPQGSDGVNMADIEVKCVLLKGKKNPSNWSESDPAYSIWSGFLYPNCGTYNFCNGGFTFPSQWEGKTVKLIAHIINSDVYSTPVYVTVGTPHEYDEPDGAISTQSLDDKKPIITTDKTSYIQGNTVIVKMSKIDAGDVVKYIFCRIPKSYNASIKNPCNCPTSVCNNIDRFCSQEGTNYNYPFELEASKYWAGYTLKIIAYNKTKDKWSNEIYIDIPSKDENDISYLTPDDYNKAFSDNAFNWRFAYWLGKAAYDSYDKDGNNKNDAMFEMRFENIKRSVFNDVKYDVGEKWIYGQKYIMISIRGSAADNNYANWFTNADANPRRWEDGKETNGKLGFTAGAINGAFQTKTLRGAILCAIVGGLAELWDQKPEAHGGFYYTTLGPERTPESNLGIWKDKKLYGNYSLNDLVSDNPNARYIITGHSLGGAIAELLSLRISEIIPSNQIICYGFASPPVGDGDLVALAHNGRKLIGFIEVIEGRKVSNRIHKLVNHYDPVPYLGIDAYSIAGDVEYFTEDWASGNQFGHSMSNVYLKKLIEKAK